MKIFPTSAIRAIDAYTIEHEPISSIDLMERAARALFHAVLEHCTETRFVVFAGPGNNGGDGLAVARMLHNAGREVAVWLINPKGKLSPDCAVNLERLKECGAVVNEVCSSFEMPFAGSDTVIVDALFGSGLSKPVEDGLFASVIEGINSTMCKVLAVDMPSGLPGECDALVSGVAVRATYTFTLQFPKVSLLMPENACYAGEVRIIDIALSKEGMEQAPTDLFFLDENDIKGLLKPRWGHAHKGCFGHGLLVAGSRGMAGASVLAARAALRSGMGLLTVHLPACNNSIMQVAVPEAMTSIDSNEACFSEPPCTGRYNAVAVGPGLGTSELSERALLALIDNCRVPMVVDADALNIIARNPHYFSRLPKGSIITPHPGEFARLFGKASRYSSINSMRSVACESGIAIVLKGAYTAIIAPDGNVYFNSTGNPGMATAGSGDVLSGVLLSFLAQGYTAKDAALAGVYLHGLAGDYAASAKGVVSMVAGDIVDSLSQAFVSLENRS